MISDNVLIERLIDELLEKLSEYFDMDSNKFLQTSECYDFIKHFMGTIERVKVEDCPGFKDDERFPKFLEVLIDIVNLGRLSESFEAVTFFQHVDYTLLEAMNGEDDF